MRQETSISLCMISLDEASFIGRALRHVEPYVDEMIVVDGGSRDATVAIAQRYGATTIQSTWQHHFGDQRNVALRHASGDWILVLDPDELCERSLLESLPRLTSNPLGVDLFEFLRLNYVAGHLLQSGPDWQDRLFRNNGRIRYRGCVHERVTGHSRGTKALSLRILHRKSAARQRRQNRYYWRFPEHRTWVRSELRRWGPQPHLTPE